MEGCTLQEDGWLAGWLEEESESTIVYAIRLFIYTTQASPNDLASEQDNLLPMSSAVPYRRRCRRRRIHRHRGPYARHARPGRRALRELRRSKPQTTCDRLPRWLLSRHPVGNRDHVGYALCVGRGSIRIGGPASAGVRLLVVLHLLAGGVDVPLEVVGEGRLGPPVVSVGRLGEGLVKRRR